MRHLGKFILSMCIVSAVVLVPLTEAKAFLFDAEVLEQAAITKLSNQELQDTYIDLLIEIKVSTTFSEVSGFNKKDYDKFKALLHYQVKLIKEIQKRDLDLPDIPL